jgi:hypothetical protein
MLRVLSWHYSELTIFSTLAGKGLTQVLSHMEVYCELVRVSDYKMERVITFLIVID